MLKDDLRDLLYPFTAKTFADNPGMKLKEILTYTKAYDIKNLLFLNSHDNGNLLKLLNSPNGPTFTFKI